MKILLIKYIFHPYLIRYKRFINQNARPPITDNRAQIIDNAKIWKISNISYFRYR